MNDFNLSDLTEFKREPRVAKLVRATPLWITPNGISYTRIMLALPLAFATLWQWYGTVLILLLIAAISDWYDGALAHARNEETVWGAFLDQLADKSIVLAPIPGLFLILSAYFTFQFCIIVIGDATLVAIRLPHLGFTLPSPVATDKVKANNVGKLKLVAQMLALACIIGFMKLHPPGRDAPGILDDIIGSAGMILLPVATALTVASLVSRFFPKKPKN